ncbi:MAG: sulfite exporter TauE/SafE family protein [Chloroflexota bacterium]|nr:sulfite exporter TauE/SafE family protein [Chloroflexota bacterium]
MLHNYFIILLGTGAGAGFASGLLGIGGGFIVVPISYWVICAMGIPQAIAIRTAFGTSLLAILPTVVSGAWRHNKERVIQWKVALILGLSGLVGAFGGATLASYLSADVLEIILGGLFLAAALWMAFGQRIMLKPTNGDSIENRPSVKNTPWLSAICGLPIGVLVGLTGVGGGALIVPVLVMIFCFPMHMAIGTSLASIMFTSLGGIIGYITNGIGVSPLPYSVGYINLPIWLCLVVTSIPLAQLGARVAHALPARRLEYLFIAFMVYVGLRMVGVF